jgi:hypothetical protein
MMPNTVDMEETLVGDMGDTQVADMGGTLAREVTMAVEVDMEETLEVDMGGTLVMAAMAMEVTMGAEVDMAAAEGAATMDVVGGVTMEGAAVDAALMLVKLLMQRPKPSLKTKAT